jgi:hypothetical protein
MPNAPVGKKLSTGRPPTKRATERQSAAQARAEAERRRRSRILYATVASAVVVVLIVVLVVVKVAGGSSHSTAVSTGGAAGTPTPTSVTAALSSIPASQLAQAMANAGGGVKPPTPISGSPLGGSGKPEVLYVGAGYCPYCAAERWALVTALLKFGTFTGLNNTHSSSDDVNPNTPTFSFHGSTYSSPYLTFTPVEETTSDPNTRLDTPTAAQDALLQQYTGGTIPFVDFDGRYLISGAQYDGKVLAGNTVEQVATQATDPSTPIGSSVQASAGTIVKALCQVTGGQPGNVCTAVAGSGQ